MMRRAEKEIKDTALLEKILTSVPFGRLAMVDGRRPYIVPVNFGYQDRTIYIHSAGEGHKLEVLRANPAVCFEVDTDTEIKTADSACAYGFTFKSVLCFGTAGIVTDTETKITALNAIMKNCTGRPDWTYKPESLARIVIIKINVEEMTGKQG